MTEVPRYADRMQVSLACSGVKKGLLNGKNEKELSGFESEE